MGFGTLRKSLIGGSVLRSLGLSFRRILQDVVPAKWGRRRKARISRDVRRGIDMNEVGMLCGGEPRKTLQTVIDKKVPAIMSYLSKGKWHVAKVLLTNLGTCRLDAEVSRTKRPHPINIRPDQPVGVSLKYGYGKFIFETKVVALEPLPGGQSGGRIVLEVPDRIEIVQRRSYFRVDVPALLKVNTFLWHRGRQKAEPKDNNNGSQDRGDARAPLAPEADYWQGKLIDISAGGAQIAVDTSQEPDFKNGQFIGVRFTPMPYETPLMFNAQIRNILPTADGKSVCLGLQIVGLEASCEGRQILSRLVGIVERYYQINQSSVKQQDFQGAPNAI